LLLYPFSFSTLATPTDKPAKTAMTIQHKASRTLRVDTIPAEDESMDDIFLTDMVKKTIPPVAGGPLQANNIPVAQVNTQANANNGQEQVNH